MCDPAAIRRNRDGVVRVICTLVSKVPGDMARSQVPSNQMSILIAGGQPVTIWTEGQTCNARLMSKQSCFLPVLNYIPNYDGPVFTGRCQPAAVRRKSDCPHGTAMLAEAGREFALLNIPQQNRSVRVACHQPFSVT